MGAWSSSPAPSPPSELPAPHTPPEFQSSAITGIKEWRSAYARVLNRIIGDSLPPVLLAIISDCLSPGLDDVLACPKWADAGLSSIPALVTHPRQINSLFSSGSVLQFGFDWNREPFVPSEWDADHLAGTWAEGKSVTVDRLSKEQFQMRIHSRIEERFILASNVKWGADGAVRADSFTVHQTFMNEFHRARNEVCELFFSVPLRTGGVDASAQELRYRFTSRFRVSLQTRFRPGSEAYHYWVSPEVADADPRAARDPTPDASTPKPVHLIFLRTYRY